MRHHTRDEIYGAVGLILLIASILMLYAGLSR